MLGIPNISILLAYILCIASALLCLIYGIINWNKGGGKDEIEEIEEELKWQEKEDVIEEKL
jgi:hypothetical protein